MATKFNNWACSFVKKYPLLYRDIYDYVDNWKKNSEYNHWSPYMDSIDIL